MQLVKYSGLWAPEVNGDAEIAVMCLSGDEMELDQGRKKQQQLPWGSSRMTKTKSLLPHAVGYLP